MSHAPEAVPSSTTPAIGRRTFMGAATALAFMGVGGTSAHATNRPSRNVSGAAVVWSEQFTGTALNQDVWEYELGNVRGNEQQHYSSSLDNVQVVDGQLVMTATERPVADQYRNTARHGANARLVKYNSGSIRTHGRKDFLYGTLEIRARLPKGKGVFPAIWLLGHDFHLDGRIDMSQGPSWPGCGELDIVEIIGAPTAQRAAQGETASAANSNRIVYGTPHFAYSRGNADGDGAYKPYALGGVTTLPQDANDDFHVFGINRTPEKMEWLLDGQVYKTMLYTDPDPQENERRQAARAGMNRPMYLQINFATGGNWAGDAGDHLVTDGAKLAVDWVQFTQTPEQKAADAAYYATLPQLQGVADIAVRQGQAVDLAANVGVDRPGYQVHWSVNDTPMFVNGGAVGGRNEVKLRASSKTGPQSLAALPVGVYSLYYTALPEGTDLSNSGPVVPTVPADRATAVLAVLPAEGLTGNARATVGSVKLPQGWEFIKRSERFDRNDAFDVTFVNPLDTSVPAKKRPHVSFTLRKDSITLR